jgi:hypothetical protein
VTAIDLGAARGLCVTTKCHVCASHEWSVSVAAFTWTVRTPSWTEIASPLACAVDASAGMNHMAAPAISPPSRIPRRI